MPPVDFHYSAFGEGACFTRTKFEGGARFHWTTFGKRALLDQAHFGDGASFGGAQFDAGASFDGSSFGEGASFIQTKFSHETSFFGTKFDRGAIFDGAEFGDDTTYMGSEFGEDTSFERARFGERTLFVENVFGDGAWFTGASFNGESGFWGCKFHGSASFSRLQVQGNFQFAGKIEASPLRVFQCDTRSTISFESLKLAAHSWLSFTNLSLERASFFGTKLSAISFSGVIWPNDINGNLVFPGRIENGEFQEIADEGTLVWLEELCRELKESYSMNLDYSEASKFRWAELEYRRRRILLKATGESGGIRPQIVARALGLYRTLGGYGVRAGNTLKIMLAALVAVILLQGLLGIHHSYERNANIASFPCSRHNNSPFRRIGVLEGEAGACPNSKASLPEIFLYAGKFTLLDATYLLSGKYEPATAVGRGLSLILRIFLPIQLLFLLITVGRRFEGLFRTRKKPQKEPQASH
ncbi:MAG: pentapeptide repeat-containing protein [Nitrospinaceae bacterium]|nr:pentapeptide repeat-containing protein [Nitrospinaceae bacterium]MBT7857006.1 pentapeptide repeat-containing protein [Nitrospinaceae bacterium]